MPALVGLVFNSRNEAAQAVAARQAARLVTRAGGVTAEVRKALRALIVQSIREGIDPYSAARMIRGMVGMNAPQAAAALSYRHRLIDSGLSIDRVNKLLDKYVQQKIRERALSIAKTETIDALARGAAEAARQAQRSGLLGSKARKVWSVSGLSGKRKPCPLCAAMNGRSVKLSEKFNMPDGRKLDGPTAHPRCKCALKIYPD